MNFTLHTRVVVCISRNIQVFLRDLPTIYNFLGVNEQAAAAQMRLADQKDIRKKMSKLSDGSFIARVIGYCQVLNSYARASLDAQYVRSFPTTVLESLEREGSILERLGNQFEFETEELHYAGIGIPSELIAQLKVGSFKPHVTAAARTRRAGRMNIERQERRNVLSNLGENAEMIELPDVLSWKNNTDDVSAEDIVVGEIPIENFRDRDQDKVEKFMSEICKKLKGNLDERLKTSDLIQTAHTVLTGSFDWCDMQDQGLAREVQDNLKKLVNKMGLEWQENLDHSHDDLCTGYLRWVLTSKSTREQNPDITTEKLWEKYFNKYKEDERSALLIAMFPRVQLKTYSEAIAETVGSVMTLAQARFSLSTLPRRYS